MPRRRTVIEYRDYALPPQFPVIVLTGERWRISDRPSEVYHFHNCMEIGICESDGATVEFPDMSFHVSAGDVTVISSDFLHTTYSDRGCRSEWSYVYSSPDELLHLLTTQLGLPRPDVFRSVLRNYRALIHPEDMPIIAPLVSSIIQEMDKKPPNYELSVRGLFLTLMSKLVTVPGGVEPRVRELSGGMPIAPALLYIEDNYSQQFPIPMLADLCHMSYSHFRRMFQQIMGCGPLEHLNRTRIEHACTLLRTTQDNILDISERSGFTSLSSFNRHFLATTGATPTQWRRKINSDQEFTIQNYRGWLVPPDETDQSQRKKGGSMR